MPNASSVNSENYWNKRFAEDWELHSGEAQSTFFTGLALEMLPAWFKAYFREQKLSLCDWGCAEGEGTNILAKQYPHNEITGIDFADAAIQKAKAKFPKVSFKTVDLLTETYKQRYDVIFSSNVLEHFHSPWETFQKISAFANEFFVVMVPFGEDPHARIPEHFASFALDTIPAYIDGWTLVHLAIKNTEALEETYWAGKQTVMIFAKPDVMHRLNLRAADIHIDTHEVEEKEARITALLEEVATKNKQILSQKAELRQNWLQLTSVRYRAANKVADAVGLLIPPESRRRKALGLPTVASQHAAKLSDSIRRTRFNQEMARLAKKHSAVIVHSGMPWNAIMRQRPHHLTEQLAGLGYMIVYIDPEAEQSYKISDNILVVKGYQCLDILSPLRNRTALYYLSSAGFPSSFTELKSITDRGFGLIYEYVDELHESISGDLSKQLEVFERLEELDPVLLLASSKRLYSQLAQRFPKERLLLNENGVDDKQFAPTKRSRRDAPEDIREIIAERRPIVGYYGALAPWLDYDLINGMTAARPEYEFIFIGIDYGQGLLHLVRRDNVHYLGPKDYAKLASYSYWFDCAIVPFGTGEIAKSTSPLKLFEYMAMGLPTVCTRDLRECRGYKGVLLSQNAKEFVQNVDKALKLKQSKKARDTLIGYAKKNTWKVRAKDIAAALDKLRVQ